MQMNKGELRGFSHVFRFTLIQAIRSKSLVITMVLMVVVATLAFPIMGLMESKGKSKKCDIKKVYVKSDLGVDIPFKEAVKDKKEYRSIVFEDITDIKEAKKSITQKKEKAVILECSLNLEEGSYIFHISYNAAKGIDSSDAEELGEIIKKWFNTYKVNSLNVNKDIIDTLEREVYAESVSVEEFTKSEGKTAISEAQYQVVYFLMMLSYMVIIMAANMVASKIVEEKTNRIVEYLMTTVRPMALILGKIVATILVVVSEFIFIAVGLFVGKNVSKVLFDYTLKGGLSIIMDGNIIKGLSVTNAVICVIVIALGILLYSMISGLFGATVSKIDEMQQGMKTFQIIILTGFFASFASLMIMSNVEINEYVVFTMICPITSMFVLPGALIVGKATTVITIFALILLVLTNVLVMIFVSLVYESVIVSNGEPTTLKKMIGIPKASNRLKRNGGKN